MESLTRTSAPDRFSEVVLELVICEVSCLETTFDQVISWSWLRVEVIDDCPEPSTDPIANDRIADPATDHVAHGHWWILGGDLYETDSQWPTLSPPGRCGEQRELPSGSDPTGHFGLDRQLVTALVTPGFQNGSAGTGAHTSAKAVGLGPLSLIRLIGTLHKILISKCFNALRGTPWGSLARYWEQSYPTRHRPRRGR